MPKYEESTNLKNLGESLIAKHHKNFGKIKICYEFRDEASISNGRVIAGRCIRVDDRNYTIHGYDIIIEIAKDVWTEATDNYRTAIMDHELSHIAIRFEDDGEPARDASSNRIKTYLKHHDIEEFADVLERYGSYHAGLREFLKAFERNKKRQEAEDEGDPDLAV